MFLIAFRLTWGVSNQYHGNIKVKIDLPFEKSLESIFLINQFFSQTFALASLNLFLTIVVGMGLQ